MQLWFIDNLQGAYVREQFTVLWKEGFVTADTEEIAVHPKPLSAEKWKGSAFKTSKEEKELTFV